MDATAPREKAFLLARPEQRLLEAIARRLPARVLPDHLTALALLAAAGFAGFRALGGGWGVGALLVVQGLRGRRAARRAVARRLARRHARPRPQGRAPALRLLPRPPRRCALDRPRRHRPGPDRLHASHGRARAPDRVPRTLDKHVPGDAGSRRVPPRLWPPRPDRGPPRADRHPRR